MVRRSPQARFLVADQEECLYGGAAGGGKSDALLMAAAQYVEVPGYAALLFRRTFADLALPGALMDRAKTWWEGTDAHWNADTKTWTFPSGATITFGYMEHERDKFRYKSAEFQFIGFDELTTFTESMYTFMFSRLRRLADSKVPIRMRSASNPGDIGHEWVKQRFLTEGATKGRLFVPAKLADNPSVDRVAYTISLQHLDPVTRAQMLDGSWEVIEKGDMFDRVWFTVLSPKKVPPLEAVVVYVDLAATEAKKGKDPDWTVCTAMGVARGQFYVLGVDRFRESPATTEARVQAFVGAYAHRAPAIWIEQEPGSAGKSQVSHYQRNVLIGRAVYGHKVTGDKVVRAEPFSAAAQNGNVFLVEGPWISDWYNELEQFPSPEIKDDQVDSASGAHNRLSLGRTGGTAGSGGEKRQTQVPPRVPKQGSTGTVGRRR